MPNSPGSHLPNRFRPGQVLTADDLNAIVRMVAQRLIGGKGVRVRTFGDRIIIERDPPVHRTVNTSS